MSKFQCSLTYNEHPFNPNQIFQMCQKKEEKCTLYNWGKTWKTKSHLPACVKIEGDWNADLRDVCACWDLFDEQTLSDFKCDLEYNGHSWHPYQVYEMCQTHCPCGEICDLADGSGTGICQVDHQTCEQNALPPLCPIKIEEPAEMEAPPQKEVQPQPVVPNTDTCTLSNWSKVWMVKSQTPECKKIEGNFKAAIDDVCACYELFDEQTMAKFHCSLTYNEHPFNPNQIFQMCQKKEEKCTLYNWGKTWKSKSHLPACVKIEGDWNADLRDVCACWDLFDERTLSDFKCDLEYNGHSWHPYQVYEMCQTHCPCGEICDLADGSGSGICQADHQTCEQNELPPLCPIKIEEPGEMEAPPQKEVQPVAPKPDTCTLLNWSVVWMVKSQTPECKKIDGNFKADIDDVCACYELFDEQTMSKFHCSLTYNEHSFNPNQIFQMCQKKEEKCTLYNWGKVWRSKSHLPACVKIEGDWNADLRDVCACWDLFDEQTLSDFKCDLEYNGHSWHPYEVYEMCQTQCPCGEICTTGDGVSGICQADHQTCAQNIAPPNCPIKIEEPGEMEDPRKDEPCMIVDCMRGYDLVGSDSQGCGGRCVRSQPRCTNGDSRPECQQKDGCPMKKCVLPPCPSGQEPIYIWGDNGCRGCFKCDNVPVSPKLKSSRHSADIIPIPGQTKDNGDDSSILTPLFFVCLMGLAALLGIGVGLCCRKKKNQTHPDLFDIILAEHSPDNANSLIV